jgi:rubrerythrin
VSQPDQPDQPAMTAAAAMSRSRIDDLGEFLVHALELEHESAAHYAQLADSMEVHHNNDVAALFRRLAALSAEHAERIAERGRGIELPHIAPWAFKWNCPGAPEDCDCLDTEISYRMTALQALRLALHNESRGQAFYAHVAATSINADVRRMASETVAEETEHAALLRTLLNEQQRHAEQTPEDLDPPHVPA